MNEKNIFMTCHGMRLKHSFFKLEKNIRVFMHCTDSPLSYTTLINRYITKFIMGKNHSIYDYIKFKKTYFKINEKDEKLSETLLLSIQSKKIIILNAFRNTLDILLKYISYQTSHNLDKIANEKNNNKYIDKIKEMSKISLKFIIEDLMKLFTTYGNKKDKIKFQKNINKFIKIFYMLKNIIKMEKFYSNKINKLKLQKHNDKSYNLCVFSGNLTNNIKSTLLKNNMCKNALDLNICPNIQLYQDEGMFRDFITEMPVKIEIRNKDTNEIIRNSEQIIKLINNDIQKQLNYKLTKTEKYYGESIYELDINEPSFENKNIYKFLSNGDYLVYIKTLYNELYTKSINIGKNINKYRLAISMNELKIKDLLEKDVSKNDQRILHFEEQIQEKNKNIIENQDLINKNIKKMEKLKKIEKASNYLFYIHKEENQLFYSIGKWKDSNIINDFKNIIHTYIKSYLSEPSQNYNLFPYYDTKHHRFLEGVENSKKQKSEFKNIPINLRDILLYLYNYYKMDENPELTLDFSLLACLSGNYVPSRIYKLCQLSVDDYFTKKISGLNNTLRNYDNKMATTKTVNKKEHKRAPCSTYKVKNGCPSHCDIPQDKLRKTCVSKSRKRKVKRQNVSSSSSNSSFSNSTSSNSDSSDSSSSNSSSSGTS